ncbi:unnamed protein product [Symbiodinium sp. CCMP2592]|nr:unnamed protein product [Symbiodinium sp. CCMP2592]
MWPNAMRFAHPKSSLPTDWIEHEGFSVLDSVLESLRYVVVNQVPAPRVFEVAVDNAASGKLPEMDRKVIAGLLKKGCAKVRRLRAKTEMDGWLQKKKKPKTGRNKVGEEIDAMLDEIDNEAPPDWDEIEENKKLEEQFGDLSRFTAEEVEDLMGCLSSPEMIDEPQSSDPADREPEAGDGDREPKAGDGDRGPNAGAAQQKYAEAHLKIFGSDAITLDDSSSETDLATMEALVEQRNFVHPDAVAAEKEEQGLDTSKGNAKKRASGDTIPADEEDKKKKKGKKAPEEPNKTFAGGAKFCCWERAPPQRGGWMSDDDTSLGDSIARPSELRRLEETVLDQLSLLQIRVTRLEASLHPLSAASCSDDSGSSLAFLDLGDIAYTPRALALVFSFICPADRAAVLQSALFVLEPARTSASGAASPAAAGHEAASSINGADPDHSVSVQGEEPSDDAASVNAWSLLAPLGPTTPAAVPEESHEDPSFWLSEPFSPIAYDPAHDPDLRDPTSDLGSFDMVQNGERERSLDPEDIWYDSVRDHSLDAALAEGDREEVEVSCEEDPLLPVEPPAFKRVCEDARWAEVAQEAKFRRVCQDLPKLPWEQGAWACIFGTERNMLDDALRSSVQASYGSEEAGQLPPENLPSSSAFLEGREHAIKRLRALIMYDPDTTFLGMVVAKEAASLADDEALSYSFTCAFAKSASGSLIKRAGSLDRFGKWILCSRGISPLRCSEVDLFAYFSHLQSEGAGATSCQHCVEALRFLHGVAVFQVLDLEEVFSARVLGIVRIMHVTKAPLAQRPPLSVEHLSLLEQFVIMNKDHRACVVGQLVFCAHACARWADSQRVQSLTLESDDESGVVLIVAGALGSKTAISAEARTRLLPYVALGKGVSNVPWAEAWMEAREAMGLQAGGAFLLPTWSERKYDWGDFEMGAAEATNYLREALIAMGCDLKEVQGYGSHSMKSTVLTWCGRSTIIPFTEPEQRALGHHLDPTSKSPLTYSREYYLKLYAKVLAVFSTIQQGRFKPDLPGAASVAAMAQSFEEGTDRGSSRLDIPTSKLLERMDEAGESDDSDHASIDLERELEQEDGRNDSKLGSQTGTIAWVAPEKCASRADEMQSNKKDKALQLMPDGQIKINSKAAEVRCEASTDSKLRAAWQRRSLAMDVRVDLSTGVLQMENGFLSFGKTGKFSFIRFCQCLHRLASVHVVKLCASALRFGSSCSEVNRTALTGRAARTGPLTLMTGLAWAGHVVAHMLIVDCLGPPALPARAAPFTPPFQALPELQAAPPLPNPQGMVVSVSNKRPRASKQDGRGMQAIRAHSAACSQIAVNLMLQLLAFLGSESSFFSAIQSAVHFDAHVRRVLAGFAATTVIRYITTFNSFAKACEDLDVCLLEITAVQAADILVTLQLQRQEDPTVGSSAITCIKAVRWVCKNTQCIVFEVFFGELISSFLKTKLPKDRRESLPLPLYALVQWERRILQRSTPVRDIVLLGAFLVTCWASLRFADSQRIEWSSFAFDVVSLRAIAYQTKTSHQGQPFGLITQGFLHHGTHSWVARWLRVLDSIASQEVRDFGVAPSFLFPALDDDAELLRPLEPMSYPSCLRWLRYYLQFPWMVSPPEVPDIRGPDRDAIAPWSTAAYGTDPFYFGSLQQRDRHGSALDQPLQARTVVFADRCSRTMADELFDAKSADGSFNLVNPSPCPLKAEGASSFNQLLQDHGISQELTDRLLADGWDAKSFRHVVCQESELAGVLPEMFPDTEVSLMQRAKLRAVWSSLQRRGSNDPAPAEPLGSPAKQGSGWSEAFAPKLDATRVATLKKRFLEAFPSEILTAMNTPSLRLLSTAVDAEVKKNWSWIPWKSRMTQQMYEDSLMQKPAKRARIETLQLSDLLLDEPPQIDINDSTMGISMIRRLLEVHDNALALAGTAHLARLKAYTSKFLSLVSQKFPPETNLRPPSVLEAQQADKHLWSCIFQLVIEKEWQVNDAIYEFTEIRGDMSSWLQPRAKAASAGNRRPYAPGGRDNRPPTPPPGRGNGKGKGKAKSPTKQGTQPRGVPWVREYKEGGQVKKLCIGWQIGKCQRGNSCEFTHGCVAGSIHSWGELPAPPPLPPPFAVLTSFPVTIALPELCRDLNALFRFLFPNEHWNALCVSRNGLSALHSDSANIPGSRNLSLSLGAFSGGHLWIEDLSCLSQGQPTSVASGSGWLHGCAIDTHRKAISFDGRIRHMTLPFSGERWALTAFSLPDVCCAELERPQMFLLRNISLQHSQCPARLFLEITWNNHSRHQLSMAVRASGGNSLTLSPSLDPTLDVLCPDLLEQVLFLCGSGAVAYLAASPLAESADSPDDVGSSSWLLSAMHEQTAAAKVSRCTWLLSIVHTAGGQGHLELPPTSSYWSSERPQAWLHQGNCALILIPPLLYSDSAFPCQPQLLAASYRPLSALAVSSPAFAPPQCASAFASSFATIAAPLLPAEGRELSLQSVIKSIPRKGLFAGPHALHDGAGKRSIADWSSPASHDAFRGLRKALLQFCISARADKRLLARGSCPSNEPLFSSSEVSAARDLVFPSLGMQTPDNAWYVHPYQPMCLHAFEALAQHCGDQDIHLFPHLRMGVPTGYLNDIPPSNCFWPPKGQSGELIPLALNLENWKSADVAPEVTSRLLQEELDAGYCFKFEGTLEEAKSRWPVGLALGKLGVVRAPGRAERLVLDNSVAGTNSQCTVPERQCFPSIHDVSHSFPIRETSDRQMAICIDVKQAHKRCRIRDSEQGLLGFTWHNALYFFRCCPFGAVFSQHWWGRVGGCTLRLLHTLLFLAHVGLLFVDDFIFSQAASLMPLSGAVICLFLQILGVPVSWKKLQISCRVNWIGWRLCFSSGTVSLREEKRLRLLEQVRSLLRGGGRISTKELESFLGLAMWACALFPTMRAMMHPFYKDLWSPAAFERWLQHVAPLASMRPSQVADVEAFADASEFEAAGVPFGNDLAKEIASCEALAQVPEGYAPIQLRQMVTADKRLFMLAAESLPADLRASRPGDKTPLDNQIVTLMFSPEISQYLVPMPKPHVPPPPPGGKALADSLKRALGQDLPFDKNFLSRAWKKGKGGKGGKGTDKEEDPAKRFNLPEGCCDRNDKNQPLCFLWNQGKCKWKGKGKRCNRGFHQCGRVIVEDPEGEHHITHEGRDFRGRAISFRDGMLRFAAREVVHWTEPWLGTRVILVSYTDGPPSASAGETPFALELFSGRGRLSQCLRQAGFTVVSVDHKLAHSLVPVCKSDLATRSGQAFVWSLLESCCPAFVHLGLPSDTATIRGSSSGGLRSSQHPLGCPDLKADSVEAKRVEEANRMYRFAFEVACFCLAKGVPFCIENPPGSRLWQILTGFAQALKDPEMSAKWQALQSVELHCCMFGGARARPLRLKCTAGLFDCLALLCDKKHEHKPWSLSRSRLEVAEDAAYPLDLCRRMVAALLSFMSKAGKSLPCAVRLHDQSLASVGVQPRRHKPLIPEYKSVVQVPVDSPIPTGAKVLSASQLQGVDVADQTPSSSGAITLGFWHSPSEFFHKAESLAHPMDTTRPVAMVTKAAIDASLQVDPNTLAEQRKSFLGYLEEKIRRLQPREDALHQGMPKYMQEVLKGKNLLAWEELLRETGYTDLDCVRFMKEGVRLVGCEEHPKDFAKKVSPASLLEEELRTSARHRRNSLLGLGRSFPSEEDASLLAQATAEEVDAGFLQQGMTAEEVSAFFGHEDWGVVRRFVLIQDGGRKVRPIDDCLEAQINAAYTSTIALQLHDSDYVASMALFIAERLQGIKADRRTPWHGKCLDLSKAYKQMAVHPRDRDLCVIMIQDQDGVATYHICNALMFGASASVFAFVRVSRSLWWIINKCLKVPCACYFDDYPLFNPTSSATSVDQDVSQLLDLLGWRHAKSGAKGKPFDSSFDVLGTRLDLGEILSGKIVLANKVGRAEKILEKVSTASLGNGSFRQSLQVLIGHLNFASGFFAGRALRHVAYDLNQLLNKDWLSAKDSLDELGSRISLILQSTPPRTLMCNRVRQPILVWTDGSWEKGIAGIGAVEWDPIASKGAVWAGRIPNRITAQWLRTEDHTQEQIISQVELYAMALIRHLRKEAWTHRRIILFCDNEAARFTSIKGGSSSHSMNLLVQAWDHPNLSHPAYLWIERVPSFSNIADGPSRAEPEEALQLTNTSSCRAFETDADLESLLFSRRRKEMG